MSDALYVPRGWLRSKAYKKLTKKQSDILLEFYGRRTGKWKNPKTRTDWIPDHKEIILPYKQIKELCGIKSDATVATAITEIVELGFLDIPHAGMRINRDCSRYKISERWINYGTPEFEFQTRAKDTRKLGITTDNWKEIHAMRKTNATSKNRSGHFKELKLVHYNKLKRTSANAG